jgi:hypothetical protein
MESSSKNINPCVIYSSKDKKINSTVYISSNGRNKRRMVHCGQLKIKCKT